MRQLQHSTIAVQIKRWRRKVRQREKLHRRLGGQRQWPFAKARFCAKLVRIYAPAEINIVHSVKRQSTLSFCKRIRQIYLQNNQSVVLDFTKTRAIQASAMLVVVAEVDRAQRMGRPGQRFQTKLPDEVCERTKIVREVLDQIELLARTGHVSVHNDKSDFHETVRYWRYATGTRVDEEPGDVLEKHEGRLSPSLMEKMQIGLMEALTNSLHHAYGADRHDGCRKFKERRWWMFTHEDQGMLQVIVCDLGIGIARSLPLKWDKHFLRKLLNVFSHDSPGVASIKMALVLGQTSTEDENRGKGMHQIWNAVHASSVGGVAIMSGNGHLYYDAATGEEKDGHFDSEMLGTLISWRVPIGGMGEKSDG